MRVNKGSLTNVILDLLEKSVDAYVRIEDYTYNSKQYVFNNRGDKPLAKSSLSKAISRLKEAGILESSTLDNQLVIKLTDTGRLFLKESSDSFEWDGKWRIVIFDIPEQKRLIRDMFRRNLKKWGFKPLQKSVWISKKDFYNRLTKYITDLKLQPWVVVIETNKISSPIT